MVIRLTTTKYLLRHFSKHACEHRKDWRTNVYTSRLFQSETFPSQLALTKQLPRLFEKLVLIGKPRGKILRQKLQLDPPAAQAAAHSDTFLTANLGMRSTNSPPGVSYHLTAVFARTRLWGRPPLSQPLWEAAANLIEFRPLVKICAINEEADKKKHTASFSETESCTDCTSSL